MQTASRLRAPLLSLAAVLALGAASAPAVAQAPAAPMPAMTMHAMAPAPTTFSLSAFGETRLAPDMATINLGVNTEAPTAGEALRANAVRMNAVMAALKKGGLADRDIQTSNLSINPQYVYQENQPPKLTGYQVSNQVTVTVRDLSRLGPAIDATVSAGANSAGGISLGLSDPSAAEDAARLSAVKALNAKAELYARATGYRIVRLVSLNEGGGYVAPPQPYPVFAMAKREMSDSTPVAGGEMKVRIDVSGVFELAR